MQGLEKLLKPGHSDELMARMAPLPPGYTHVGIANVQLPGGAGRELTVTAAGPGLEPQIFEPRNRVWRPMMVR